MFQFPFEAQHEAKFEQASTLPKASAKTFFIVAILVCFGLAIIPLMYNPILHLIITIVFAHVACILMLFIRGKDRIMIGSGTVLIMFNLLKYLGIIIGIIGYSVVFYIIGVSSDWKNAKDLFTGFMGLCLSSILGVGIYTCVSWPNHDQVRPVEIAPETARSEQSIGGEQSTSRVEFSSSSSIENFPGQVV